MPKVKVELPQEVDWPAYTQEWFSAWAARAKLENWSAEQIYYLIDTALVHAAVWCDLDTASLGELHRRESYMGLTFEPQKTQTEKAKVTPLEVVRAKYKGKEGRAKAANQD